MSKRVQAYLDQVEHFARAQSLVTFALVGHVDGGSEGGRSIPRVLRTGAPSSSFLAIWVTPFLVIIIFVGKPHQYMTSFFRKAKGMSAKHWRAWMVNCERSAKSLTFWKDSGS